MEKLKPKLFSVMKTYSKEQFIKDVIAGIIVAIIALPLSIALALASGVNPERGIYTAIVAGFVISFLGGSRVQISGPTAAFASIVAGIVARNGMDGLIVATILAGIMLIIMGICRFGSLIKYIPYTITTGFTSGIAITIAIGQVKDFLGLTVEGSPIETLEKAEAAIKALPTINWYAFLVGAVSLAILILWPKLTEKLPTSKISKVLATIPPSLIVVIVSVLMVSLGNLPVNTIGSLYEISNKLPAPHIPQADFAMVKSVMSDAFTIAILAGIESLLSCVVSDGMIGSRHRSNMELVAQGAGNVASALFGGIPATGAIARTAANVKMADVHNRRYGSCNHTGTGISSINAIRSFNSNACHCGDSFMVAYNMSEWRAFVDLIKTAPKSDIIVLVTTFILTVVFDLVVAIEIGVVLAAILFMKRMSDVADVHGWKYIGSNDAFDEEVDPDSINLRKVPENTLVYELSGPMFFATADKFLQIGIEPGKNVIILRMRSVPAMDVTALNSLEKFYAKCQKNNITLLLSHVEEQPYNMMKHAGFVDMVGEDNFCAHIDDALSKAESLK